MVRVEILDPKGSRSVFTMSLHECSRLVALEKLGFIVIVNGKKVVRD